MPSNAQYLGKAMRRKYDLPSLVRRACQHFVRPPSFFEREHATHIRGQLSAIEKSSEFARPGRCDIYQEERCAKARRLWRRRNHRNEDAALFQNPE